MLFDKTAINNCFIELADTLLFNIGINIVFKIILLLKNKSIPYQLTNNSIVQAGEAASESLVYNKADNVFIT